MSKESSDKLNWILAGALILIAIFVFASMIIVRSQAQCETGCYTYTDNYYDGGTDQYASLTVGNVPPSVSGVVISQNMNGNEYPLGGDSGLQLTPGAWTELKIETWINDNDGWSDIAGVNVIVARESKIEECYSKHSEIATRTSNNEGANLNNCYFADSVQYDDGLNGCALGEQGPTQAQFICTINVGFIAESTGKYRTTAQEGVEYDDDGWIAFVVAKDSLGQTSPISGEEMMGSAAGFDVDTVLSLEMSDHISYGTVGVNADSQVVTYPLTQLGNQIATLHVGGENMGCQATPTTTYPPTGDGSTGSVDIANQKWSLSSGNIKDNGTSMNQESVDTEVTVGYINAADGNESFNNSDSQVYFQIFDLPQVSGYCYGRIYATAAAKSLVY